MKTTKRSKLFRRSLSMFLACTIVFMCLSSCQQKTVEEPSRASISNNVRLLSTAGNNIADSRATTSSVTQAAGTTYNEEQIIQMLKGAALLASGGGGSYRLGTSILDAFKEQNPDVPIEVTVYDVEDMNPGESTFGVAIMGSPSAHADVSVLAQIPLLSYEETLELAERYDKNPQYVLALEMGGANTLIPLLCAMKYNLKVLNADLCGRAVPGLETSLSVINGLPTAPYALTDEEGNSYDLNMVNPYDAEAVEGISIAILDKLESNGAFTGFFFDEEEVTNNIPTDSLLRCLQIGQCIEEFQEMSIEQRRGTPLFEMLNEIEYDIQCVTLTREASEVQHFHQESAAGGARDVGYYYLGVEGEVGNYFYLQFDNETMTVSVLNENNEFECIATAPSMIAMYDENTGLPLTNADLKSQIIDGEGEPHKVMLGIIKNDGKWWNDYDAVNAAWKPYLEEAGYSGDVIQYPFD